jgi:hypothetical protein
VGKSTVELYCDLDGLQAPGGGSISADIIAQAQRPDLVILDRSAHGRHRIALVKNIRPQDMQTSKLLSAMRDGILVCIWSKLECGAIFSSQFRNPFDCNPRLGSLQAKGQVLGRWCL